MPFFIVTVKIPRDVKHDPHNKKTGACPVGVGGPCTDVTGEHHSLLVHGVDINEAREAVTKGAGYNHITRIEEV